jgi:hypothetical protein
VSRQVHLTHFGSGKDVVESASNVANDWRQLCLQALSSYHAYYSPPAPS